MAKQIVKAMKSKQFGFTRQSAVDKPFSAFFFHCEATQYGFWDFGDDYFLHSFRSANAFEFGFYH